MHTCFKPFALLCLPLQALVVNLDQTGIHFIPTCGCGRAQKGAKEVAMIGGEDKRQITGVLAVSASGDLLPPQLIFQGACVCNSLSFWGALHLS